MRITHAHHAPRTRNVTHHAPSRTTTHHAPSTTHTQCHAPRNVTHHAPSLRTAHQAPRTRNVTHHAMSRTTHHHHAPPRTTTHHAHAMSRIRTHPQLNCIDLSAMPDELSNLISSRHASDDAACPEVVLQLIEQLIKTVEPATGSRSCQTSTVSTSPSVLPGVATF